VRTYFYTNAIMFSLDLTTAKVGLPLEHIRVDSDQYFNNRTVQKHLGKIYDSVTAHKAHLPNHAPTIIDEPDEAGAILPDSVRKLLKKTPHRNKV
jgi:hypothetical protein